MPNSAATKPSAARGKQVMIIALVVLLLLLVGGGALGWVLLSHGSTKSPDAPAAVQPPTFYTLKPFTVNFNDGSDRMLYLGLSLELGDPASAALLNNYMPEIRNRILLLLADQSKGSFDSADGKRQLAEHLRELLSQPIQGESRIDVRQVLFTDFIVQ